MAVHCFSLNYKSSDKFGRNQTEPEVQFEIRSIGGLSIEIFDKKLFIYLLSPIIAFFGLLANCIKYCQKKSVNNHRQIRKILLENIFILNMYVCV